MGVRGGFTSIMLAASLLAAGAAPAQFSDSYGFLKAVRDRDGEKATTFLNKPGKPMLNARDPSTGETGLHIVVRRHDMVWLGFLLGQGAQVDLRDRDGDTPLVAAALLSDIDAVRLLLQAGANVNAANTRGETALILAVQRRDLPTIRLLLSAGADPKTPDRIAGKTARDYAAEDQRSTAIVKLLDEAKPKAPAKAIAGPVR